MKNLMFLKELSQKIAREQYDEDKVIELLNVIIDTSDDVDVRIKSVELLSQMTDTSAKTFKTFERCLVSDEDPKIRVLAAEILLRKYSGMGLESLKWALKNDSSSIVLRKIKDSVNEHVNKSQKVIKKTLEGRLIGISNQYNISVEEVLFLLDLDIKIDGSNYIDDQFNTGFIYEQNIFCAIIDEHIREMRLSSLNKLPSSISSLKKLEHLDLSCNHLTDLPSAICDLSNLKSLDLSWNDLSVFPEVLMELKLELLDLTNNRIKALPDDYSEFGKVII